MPGLHIQLTSGTASGLGPGAGIVYKGINVGKIESRTFHPETGELVFSAFIDNEYANLINHRTHFWNNSGIDLKVGPDGVALHTGTLESILAGGVTFNQPEDIDMGRRHVEENTSFVLYNNFDDAARRTELNLTTPYLLLFTGSVRGLSVDAPVEFRGIKVGTVEGIAFKYLPDDPDRRVPVLIKIDPSMLFNLPSNDFNVVQAAMAANVSKGLRVSLKTGSLITGQLYVDMDFLKDTPPAEVANIEGYQVLPTVSSGLGEIQEKINGLLDKINGLQLDKTLGTVNDALASLKDTLKSLNDLLGQKDTQALPRQPAQGSGLPANDPRGLQRAVGLLRKSFQGAAPARRHAAVGQGADRHAGAQPEFAHLRQARRRGPAQREPLTCPSTSRCIPSRPSWPPSSPPPRCGWAGAAASRKSISG